MKAALVIQTYNHLAVSISIRDGATGEEFEFYKQDYKNCSKTMAANASLQIAIDKARKRHAADHVIVDSNMADLLRRTDNFSLIDEVYEDIYAD